jgi:hypothetical protein
VKVRDASFALRVVRRRDGDAGIVYRRQLTDSGQHLVKIASISPLAFSAGTALLRSGVRAASSGTAKLKAGPWLPLDDDWGPRVACYGLVSEGLRNAERLHRASAQLKTADAAETAWWLGAMTNGRAGRAIRALRILVEAVE